MLNSLRVLGVLGGSAVSYEGSRTIKKHGSEIVYPRLLNIRNHMNTAETQSTPADTQRVELF